MNVLLRLESVDLIPEVIARLEEQGATNISSGSLLAFVWANVENPDVLLDWEGVKSYSVEKVHPQNG